MKLRHLLLSALFSVIIGSVKAQVPANDNCTGATFLYLDQTGNTCVSDSNIQATDDGFSNTCDAAAVLPLPPGGHEVWFSYVSTGSVNTISIIPGGLNPAQKVSVTVVNGNCSGTGTNVCNTAPTSVDPASVAFTSFPGTQIWFYATALEADGEFLVCISSTNGFINPSTNCNSATALCNTNDFSSPGTINPGSSPTPSCFNTPPVRPFWYQFRVGYNGPLEFTGFPTNVGGFRWALYDITSGCPGTEVACNSVYDPFLPFGLSSSATNCTSSPYCPPINVVAGNSYALMIDDTSQNGSGFDFTWGYGVKMLPTADFDVDSLIACGSLTADFTDNSTYTPGTIWSLNYGDGTAPINGVGANFNLPSHTFGPGTYLVTLTLTELTGCSHSFSRQIYVKPKPLAAFTVDDDSLCFDGSNPVTATFTASTSNTSTFYNWIFPNNSSVQINGFGSATAFWNTAGTINTGLQITEEGCTSDTARVTLHIFDLPIASFSIPDTGCTGIPATITYTGGAAATATYAWTYGGGTITNQTNQQFDAAWNTAGTYTLSLAIQENGCLGFPYTDSIHIFSTPVISITTPTRVCLDAPLTISPLATGAPANSTYSWNFNNATLISGNPTDGSTGTFSWSTVGPTYFTATAISPEGCLSNKDSVSFVVNPKPAASISVSDTSVCGADTATVLYNGTTPVTGNTLTWDFGGATIVNFGSTNPEGPYFLQFPASGSYPIYFVINDNICNSDTIRDTVIAGQYPVSNAGINKNTCSNQPVGIGVPNTVGYTYSWSPSQFLNSALVSNPQATVPVFGINDTTVNFIVTTASGYCTLNDTMTLSVQAIQQAYFIPDDPQCEVGNSFDFLPYYGVVGGAVQTWTIDGTPTVAPTVLNYSFANSGPHTVTLQTQTPGCPDDIYTTNVIVKPTPIVNFDADILKGCVPFDVAFQNLSPALPGASFLWNFDDGIVSFVNNPLHTYSIEGTYLPTLTITSSDTCSATDTLNTAIEAYPVPSALFNAQPLIASNINPVFNFESIFGNNNCYFDFGDGTGDSSCSTTHTYGDTGVYVVTLITSNSGGCADTFSITVEVRPNYALYIPSAFTPNNDQKNDRFEIIGEGVAVFEIKVYNRFGQIVWKTDDIRESWNGKYLNDGEECPTGVYVYEAAIKDFNRKKHNLSGRITILK